MKYMKCKHFCKKKKFVYSAKEMFDDLPIG